MQTIILWKLDPQTNVASVKSRGNDKDGGSNNISKNKHTGRLFQKRRCDCIFDDDKIHSVQLTKNGSYMMDSDDTDNTNLESLFAIRSKVFLNLIVVVEIGETFQEV